jgi:signal transduction histidine kinase
VEALGGKLHVTSAPGAGTTLHVTLPLDSVKPGDAGHWRTG